MNFSSFLGIIAALAVLVFSIFGTTKSTSIFLDPHGILIVLGGTAAASLMCFPLRTFFDIFGVFMRKFLGKNNTRFDLVIQELVDLAKGYRDSPDHLKNRRGQIKNLFLRDAIELIAKGGIRDQAIDSILLKRASTHTSRYDDEVTIFRTIAKFPPAFGLMGTTLGMIALLAQLGGKDAYKLLGPAMAVGLVATFYGLVLANLVFIPIAENLAKLNKDDEMMRDMVIDGVKLIRAKEHPLVVEEYLRSYLLPKERARLTKVVS